MDAVRAATPWQVTMGSMSLLSSHDTARWRTMCRSDDAARAGFGLLLSMPGAPTFFYGDEVGLTGETSEKARRTMPWDVDEWDQDFLDWYREMIKVRNEHPALRHGGFRWVHTEADAVIFLRETTEERLLVRTARSKTEPVELPAELLRATAAKNLINGGDLDAGDGVFRIDGAGPVHQIWSLS